MIRHLVHCSPIQSIIVQFGPIHSSSVHNGPLQSISVYLLKNRKEKKKSLGWEYYTTINYLSTIHCNYMISFDYHDNLLKRIKNLNNIFET